MKKATKYIILSSLAATSAILTACQSDNDLSQYAQRSDQAGQITFALSTETVTRSTYSTDNPHPDSLGAYGYHDLSATNLGKAAYTIFNNVKVTHDATAGTWSYTPVKYWAEYDSYSSYDFFGYMPYQSSGTSLTYSSSDKTYTLSFPFTMPGETADPIIKKADLAKAPLICNKPLHKAYPGDVVNYEMDQALTGYQLQFKIGTKMDGVRDFKIKSVKVYGTMPVSGTISRAYTYSTSAGWTAGSITWSSVTAETTAKYTADDPCTIDNKDGDGNDVVLTVTSSDFLSWGDPFFVIPSSTFKPTIVVTYDVYVDGTDTPTRQDVTNNIVFNTSNFSYGSGSPGKINNIQIKIVPSYLYVLADDDQTFGYLVME